MTTKTTSMFLTLVLVASFAGTMISAPQMIGSAHGDQQNACPPGYTFNPQQGQCVDGNACPAGTTFNPTTNKCESNPTCPAGTTLNTATHKCEANPTCPTGTNFNTATGKCEATPTVACSNTIDSLTPTQSGNNCQVTGPPNVVTPPRCSAIGGTISNAAIGGGAPDKTCTYPATATCPTGSTLNTATGKCQATPTCPTGSTFSTTTNKCETPISCPASNNPITVNANGQCQTKPGQGSG